MRLDRNRGQVAGEQRGRELEAGRPALRPLARRRELRDGADRGLRRRHAGGRLRRSPATATWSATASRACSSPRRPAAAGRGAAARPLRARATRGDGRRPRESAERYAWPRVADQVDRGLRAGDRRCPQPAGAGDGSCRWVGLRAPPTARRGSPPSDCPPWSPRRAGRQPGRRVARRVAVGVAAMARRRADRARGAEDRGRQHRPEHRPLGPQPGSSVGCALMSLSMFLRAAWRCDRARRPARAARSAGATSPRRR